MALTSSSSNSIKSFHNYKEFGICSKDFFKIFFFISLSFSTLHEANHNFIDLGILLIALANIALTLSPVSN